MNKSDLIVLGFLNRKPMYGYEIIQFTKMKGLDVWAGIKMPSIYKALQRLEVNNYISGKRVVEGNNPPRKVFTITKTGTNHFRKILTYFLESESELNVDFWMAISFMGNGISKKLFLQFLDNRIDRVSAHIKHHKEHCNIPENVLKNIPFYIKILMEMGEDMHKTEKRNLTKLKKAVLKPENEFVFLEEEEL
ncbi:MAG: PadR family transcriptional regulator [Candidatus Cloacimonetes bacterium]|nr:PadR family transcriptional regulator [Candidatus Cloacimonadota bacterium]